MHRAELIARLARAIDIQESVADEYGLTRRQRAVIVSPLFDLLCNIEEEGDEGEGQPAPAAPVPPTFTPPAIQVPPFFPGDGRGFTFTATEGSTAFQQPTIVRQEWIPGGKPGDVGHLVERRELLQGATVALELAGASPGATPSILTGASLVRHRDKREAAGSATADPAATAVLD